MMDGRTARGWCSAVEPAEFPGEPLGGPTSNGVTKAVNARDNVVTRSQHIIPTFFRGSISHRAFRDVFRLCAASHARTVAATSSGVALDSLLFSLLSILSPAAQAPFFAR